MQKFQLKPTNFFLDQLEKIDLSDKDLDKLEQKLDLLKINPKRNKSLIHKKYNLLRIRFTTLQKEFRIVYTINQPYVKILFILDRSQDYFDLEKYLRKVRDDLS